MLKKIFLRFLIAFCWLVVILSALYIPRWVSINPNDKSLTILTWGDILEPEVLANFEKKTGIKIHLNYYASNEELIVKLKATKGIGYDLIIPSDYAVSILAKYHLLKIIDQSKLNFWHKINPRLLHHDFDPQNTYSIPYTWEIFGLGYDKSFFIDKSFEASWKMIFDNPLHSYSIVMTNDPVEAVQCASLYLFGKKEVLSNEELLKIKKLLINQRSFIEAYANFRADYFLATKNCPLVVTTSSYIWRTKRLYPFVEFAIPKEGTFISIENLCIPKPSKKEALVYTLINELFSDESVKKHFNTFGFFPSTLHAVKEVELDPMAKELVNMHVNDSMPLLHFITELTTQDQIQNLWVSVKTSSSQ